MIFGPFSFPLHAVGSFVGRHVGSVALAFCALLAFGTVEAATVQTPGIAQFAGKKITQIEVKGLKRIEKAAVVGKLVTQVGQPLKGETIREDIQALFGMGYFDDIEALGEADSGGVKVIYSLRERPVIAKIDFDGNERISTSDLKDVIKLKEWSILDINKVREDVSLIQKHYEDKGYYLAKVTFQLKAVKSDEVELTYKINDYDKVTIKKITFLNNKRFSDDELKSVLQETREGGLFSFLSGSGSFKESAFKMDLQRLTLFYLDHGYIRFRYENPVVTVSDDKKWVFISIYVDEGEQYRMGAIDFGGDLLFSKPDLMKEIKLETGDIFSFSDRNADIQRLTEKYQDLGYAFTNVVPKMVPHDDTRIVDMEYDFEKGDLVYFGEINMVGNTKTYDKVIRRELKIHEGELYSGTKLRLSREAVERLGYFQPGEVVFNQVSPKGKPDTLNIDISVKERSTGTITLGMGYGTVTGIFFSGTISDINFLGNGQTLQFSAQYSPQVYTQSFNLGFTEPYFFDTLWSVGGDIYHSIYPIPYKYTTRRLGFDVRIGHPLRFVDDYTYIWLTYKFEGLNVWLPDPVFAGSSVISDDVGLRSSLIWSLIRDKRNNRYETTGGNYQQLTVETAGVGGDRDYVKATANNRLYFQAPLDFVFRNSTEVGMISAFGGSPLPSSEKFYLGGPNNMKGFQTMLLGPTIPNSANYPAPLGGAYEMFSLFELEHSLVKEAGLKFVLFFDVGDAWDPNLPSTVAGQPVSGAAFQLRTDVGAGIRWFSPIGPLRFELGFPLNPQPQDQKSVFQFFIGPAF